MVVNPFESGVLHRWFAVVAVAALAVTACTNEDPTAGPIDQQPRLEPSEPISTEGLARQAGEPGAARSAGEPQNSNTADASTLPPLLHVLGSIQSIADIDASFTTDASVVLDDLATIASLGCAASTCSPADLETWIPGQVDVVNAATLLAAIEGPEALKTQVETLRSNGVTVIGFGSDLNDALQPAILGQDDQTVAVHSISLADDTQSLATDDSEGVAGPAGIDLLREAVIKSRNDGRGVVVLVDWGNLEGRAPNARQLDDVDRIINAGADAIVGHGSEFLQRFDLVGRTTVAYSLGNASVTTDDPLKSDTAILRLEFDTPGRSCLLPATAGPSGPSLDNPDLTTCG